jgi:hypothetical protein
VGWYGPGALPSHVHDALLNGNDLQPSGAVRSIGMKIALRTHNPKAKPQ